jgi:gluconolactonase
MRTLAPLTALVTGHDTLEGPAFDRAGALYYVDWERHAIYRRSPDGAVAEFYNTGGIPAGLAFHRDGALYVADEGEDLHGVLRISDGAMTVLADSYQGGKLLGANDLVFDRDGVVYFSDPWGTSAERPIGGFYRLFPDGRLEQLDHGLAFPNGVAIAPDGAAIYLAESYHYRILRYPIGADGRVGARKVFAQLEADGVPDGMAFDEAGELYVARFEGGRVSVIGTDGRVVDEIPIPGRQVTNVAFGGPDRTTLVVTECSTGTIYQTQVRVPGLALFSDTTA